MTVWVFCFIVSFDKTIALKLRQYDDINLIDNKSNIINLLININDLPLTKSSTKSVWPILCSDNILKKVFIIGVYYGIEKSSNVNQFLEKFASEAICLVNN